MCDKDVEFNDHLFLHGKTTANMLRHVLVYAGIELDSAKTTLEMLNNWETIGRRDSEKDW